jgi:hypothetical protein
MTTTLTLASGAHHEAQDHAEKNTKVVKNRVQFDLPPRSMERPNALKLKNEPSSYAEVVRMPCACTRSWSKRRITGRPS